MLSPTLLSALRDPERRTPLQLSDDGSKLLSDDGGRSWKIINDIPGFVTDEHLESFGHQWTHFDVAHQQSRDVCSQDWSFNQRSGRDADSGRRLRWRSLRKSLW